MDSFDLADSSFNDLVDVQIDPDASKWELLIDQIIDGNVIPIIGGDILTDGINLERYLISHLAEKSDITSRPTNFSELLFDPKFKNRENIYFWLNSFCNNNINRFKPSGLLKRILSIKQFPFVITTSFFPIVESTMREVWGEREVRTMVFSNDPAKTSQKGLGDISCPADITSPTVYYMFGKVCKSAHRFVVTDTDMLSFCRSWLSAENRPPVLSNVLKDKYLLVLGNNYPDWLFRFIWYSMNLTDNLTQPFSKTQGMMVNGNADDSLIRFLNRLDTFTQKDPLFVIDTIERKLSERQDQIEDLRFAKPQKDCDVFLSYSRSDSEIAANLFDYLSNKGLKVWYDRNNLTAGAKWMEEIEQAIETCRLFVPIISEHTEEEGNAYHVYRKEWIIADKRSEGFSREFILPFASKNVDFYKANLPASFKSVNAAFFDIDSPSFSSFATDVLSIINSL